MRRDIRFYAGFYDGEGTIGAYQYWHRRPGINRIQASISQKHIQILTELKRRFGGSIWRGVKQKIWRWRISGEKCKKFALAIYTYVSKWRQKQIRRALNA